MHSAPTRSARDSRDVLRVDTEAAGPLVRRRRAAVRPARRRWLRRLGTSSARLQVARSLEPPVGLGAAGARAMTAEQPSALLDSKLQLQGQKAARRGATPSDSWPRPRSGAGRAPPVEDAVRCVAPSPRAPCSARAPGGASTPPPPAPPAPHRRPRRVCGGGSAAARGRGRGLRRCGAALLNRSAHELRRGRGSTRFTDFSLGPLQPPHASKVGSEAVDGESAEILTRAGRRAIAPGGSHLPVGRVGARVGCRVGSVSACNSVRWCTPPGGRLTLQVRRLIDFRNYLRNTRHKRRVTEADTRVSTP